jgi:hypothetical protein
MKPTLLDLVQSVLSSVNGDEVNSISDTTESLQVAEIIKTSYFNIISRAQLPVKTEIFQLEDSTDVLKPVLMYRPDNVRKVEWVKYYDTTQTPFTYKYVTILPNDQFLDNVNSFNTDQTNVDLMTFTVGGKSFNFNYRNDTQPRYCTVFNNFYFIFDAFDSSVDSTLQASKTMCLGELSPIWLMEDTFIPELDEQQVPLLLNEAKSLAYFELKQITHAKAEQEAKRQWGSLQRDKSIVDKPSYFDQLPHFGRIPNQGRSPRIVW